MKNHWWKKKFGKKHECKISRSIFESKNVISIYLEKPVDFSYDDASFLYARSENGKWLKFYISSSPLQNELIVTARNDGDYKIFFEKIDPKSKIQITESIKNTDQRIEDKPITMLIKSDGVLKIMGILRSIKLGDEKRSCLLVYQNPADEYEAFKSDLRLLNRSRWFSLVEVYSHIYPPRKGQKLKQIKGRVNKTMIKRVLKKDRLLNDVFMIGFDKEKNKTIKSCLVSLGVEKNRIVLL